MAAVTLQVEQPGGSLLPLLGDATRALTVADTDARAQLAAILLELGQKLEAGGEVSLSAASLSALETIVVSGTVSVSNLPATQAVSGSVTATATDLDIRNLVLSQDSLRQTPRPMSSYIATLTSPTTATAAAITAPDRVRVLRLDGGSKPTNTDATYVTVTVSIGAAPIFTKTLQPGEPFGSFVCLEGAAGDDLTVDLTGSGSVELNLRFESFT